MEHKKDLTVLASSTDYSAGVGLVGAITYLQDNMCDMFKKLGSDGITMIPKCHAFFVITKTKIKFHKCANWLDEITLKTSVSDVSKIRVNLNNSVYDRDDKICVEGIQELCAIDSDNRRLRAVDTTLFPVDIERVEGVSELQYSKLNFDKNEFDFKKKITIDLSNVDYYMHTNNVEYVKFCLGVLDYKIFENKALDTFEIHYVKESIIGDELDVLVKADNDNFNILIVRGEDVIVKAMLVLKDK